MFASDATDDGSSLRHLRGNAEAVLVMTGALLDRYRPQLSAADCEWIDSALVRLLGLIREGSEDALRRELEEFDRISERIADVLGANRRVA